MVAYLLFFGGMSCFVVAGTSQSPALGVIGIVLAIIALGCGRGTRALELPLVLTTHSSAAEPKDTCSPAMLAMYHRQHRRRRHQVRQHHQALRCNANRPT